VFVEVDVEVRVGDGLGVWDAGVVWLGVMMMAVSVVRMVGEGGLVWISTCSV
jgi:hypothetical protein